MEDTCHKASTTSPTVVERAVPLTARHASSVHQHQVKGILLRVLGTQHLKYQGEG